MEILLAYIILFEVRVINKSEYIKVLDNLFRKNPSDDLLIELEWHTNDMIHSHVLISSFCNNNLDCDLFGKYLLNRLEKLYLDKNIDIYELSKISYELWKNIPENIKYNEPVYILSYADDALSWGDEDLTRQIYEDIFKFYKSV